MVLVALTSLLGGGVHTVASTMTFLDGGTRSSYALLLSLGFVLLLAAAFMLAFARKIWRGQGHLPTLWVAAAYLGYLAIVNGPGVPILLLDALALILVGTSLWRSRRAPAGAPAA